MTVIDFPVYKQNHKKISMVTCYDATFARLVSNSSIDTILIGDSCAMVMHGENTTLPATIEMMADHTRSVRNGAPDKFILADMPFLSTRKGKEKAAEMAGRLLVAGANAVKIEGLDGQEDVIEHLVKSGIPVMIHLGLTPQFYNAFGGHKRQGKTEDQASRILHDALRAQELGCFGILLECIPTELAKKITDETFIPTIGIGAGPYCDGQVLVLQDLLGMGDFSPKFVHKYIDGKKIITDALNQYAQEVSESVFPHNENY